VILLAGNTLAPRFQYLPGYVPAHHLQSNPASRPAPGAAGSTRAYPAPGRSLHLNHLLNRSSVYYASGPGVKAGALFEGEKRVASDANCVAEFPAWWRWIFRSPTRRKWIRFARIPSITTRVVLIGKPNACVRACEHANVAGGAALKTATESGGYSFLGRRLCEIVGIIWR